MCSLCSQQWIVKTSFRWFFVIGKWKSCWCIKKAVVTEIFIMWSFVSVQAILCSTLCYLVKWFNSCSFTMEQKNTCAIWSEERTRNPNISDTIIMIVVVIMIIKKLVCWIANASGLVSFYVWTKLPSNKIASSGSPPWEASLSMLPPAITRRHYELPSWSSRRRLRCAVDHAGEFLECTITQN